MRAMPKKKQSIRPTASAPITAKADRMVDRLRKQHALGKDAKAAKTKGKSTADFAAEHEYSEGMIRKMKAFAGRYTLEELDALCEGRRPNGLPLHWGYVPVLLTIERKRDKAEREKFQKLAIDEGWTVPELRRQVRNRLGVSGHGRNPKFPGSATEEFNSLIESLAFVERRCEKLMDLKKVNRNRSIHAKCKRLLRSLVGARKQAHGS